MTHQWGLWNPSYCKSPTSSVKPMGEYFSYNLGPWVVSIATTPNIILRPDKNVFSPVNWCEHVAGLFNMHGLHLFWSSHIWGSVSEAYLHICEEIHFPAGQEIWEGLKIFETTLVNTTISSSQEEKRMWNSSKFCASEETRLFPSVSGKALAPQSETLSETKHTEAPPHLPRTASLEIRLVK